MSYPYIDGYMNKESGWKSEWLSPWKYLPLPYLRTVAGALALGTDTKDQDEMIEQDKEVLQNMLIPGYATHNLWKRLGHSARGPEITEAKKELRKKLQELQDEGHTKGDAYSILQERIKEQGTKEENTKQEKTANVWSEIISIFNPLNYVALPVAALLTLSTPTRSTEEQALHDIKGSTFAKDLLIPGVAPYNLFKRFGHAYRNPAMKKRKKELSQTDKKQKDKKQED